MLSSKIKLKIALVREKEHEEHKDYTKFTKLCSSWFFVFFVLLDSIRKK